MVALAALQWCVHQDRGQSLALAVATTSLQSGHDLGRTRFPRGVCHVAHVRSNGMDRQRHLVISGLLLETGWNLRDFCDWMSAKGYELGKHYHWHWHGSNDWAIRFYDERVATMVALAFPDKHK